MSDLGVLMGQQRSVKPRRTTRYRWSLRRYWLPWFWQDVRRVYYRLVHCVDASGLNGSMLPVVGRGRFVSVLARGRYLDIVAHTRFPDTEQGFIRLVPYQPNHGVMVEFWRDGRLSWRVHADYRAFYLLGTAGIPGETQEAITGMDDARAQAALTAHEKAASARSAARRDARPGMQ